MVHKTTVVERPANYPPYKWEVSCECGWQGRFSQEVNAESAGNNHLARNGVEPDSVTEPEVPTPPPDETSTPDKPGTSTLFVPPVMGKT
jgi:hypothetical protein